MDIATVVGVILGSFLILLAVLLGGSLMAYIDPASVLIVVGGGLAATMTSFTLAKFLKLPKVVLLTVFGKTEDPGKLVEQLVELAEIARRDGILALEASTENIDDPFLVRGISMAVDGSDPEVIEAIMETELENLMDRHAAGKGLLDAVGRFAPAFGMIGTLIGLVAMLSNMDDPAKIGSGMAAALLTTLYGALLANVLALPLADKLGRLSADEVLNKTIIIQGVMAIQSGENPRNVQSKLLTFLPPTERPEEEQKQAA
ncbi:MAG: motility protein A [Planctomycetota bacterium]